MLVLSRRTREEIVIDDHIRVVILEVSNGRVKLGLTAPDDVRIRRVQRETQKRNTPSDYDLAVCG